MSEETLLRDFTLIDGEIFFIITLVITQEDEIIKLLAVTVSEVHMDGIQKKDKKLLLV